MMIDKGTHYINTAYETAEEQLLKEQCPECYGLGMQDDAECGDISCNKWLCKSCHGTGFKNGKVFTLTLKEA